MADALDVETQRLAKRYRNVAALSDFDFGAPKGQITALLGRAGAGKTTLIKILAGMVRPTAGKALVFGLDATAGAPGVRIRRRMGIVTEEKELYGNMTVERLLEFTAAFYPDWSRQSEAQFLRRFGLRPDTYVQKLSKGSRTKLALMLVLCRRAELMLLDEPTSGLDPEAAEEVLQLLVGQVARTGATLLMSSHNLAEVEQIADRVAVVDAGRCLICGPLDELQESHRRIRMVFAGEAPQPGLTSGGVLRATASGRMLEVVATSPERVLSELQSLAPNSVEVTAMSLKEIFLETIRKGG